MGMRKHCWTSVPRFGLCSSGGLCAYLYSNPIGTFKTGVARKSSDGCWRNHTSRLKQPLKRCILALAMSQWLYGSSLNPEFFWRNLGAGSAHFRQKKLETDRFPRIQRKWFGTRAYKDMVWARIDAMVGSRASSGIFRSEEFASHAPVTRKRDSRPPPPWSHGFCGVGSCIAQPSRPIFVLLFAFGSFWAPTQGALDYLSLLGSGASATLCQDRSNSPALFY